MATQPAAAAGAAKKTAAKSAAKKAAAAEVAGGGPEDPLADIAAASALLPKSGGAGRGGSPRGGGAFAASNPARWVLVEFLVCFVILGLGTIVAPAGQKNGGAAHLAVKGSALALLFFILGLMTGGGAKSRKAAGALGGLVTAAYIFTSQDSANLVRWVDGFFSPPSSAASGGSAGAASGAGVGGLGGAVAGTVTGAAQ